MRLPRRRLHVVALLAAAALCACSSAPSTAPVPQPKPVDTGPPPIQREMRGLWIATVANIDWPSRTTLTATQQQAELTDILDRAAASGFNAVMFHIRPAADAVYSSSIEPWASMLTGTQGKDPGYDPPGEPAVHDHVMRVVSDIVQRYDIDGVHADDYFYPYQEHDTAGKLIDFPDSASYAKSGSTLSRDDWRRANVDTFIERLYREVHALKPSIKVGISPFGIWRPGNPASIAGLDAYATIYADSRKWLQQGWVDYLAPQLYWSIAAPQQSYPALLNWWLAQNTMGRNVWPGLAAYRVGSGSASAFDTSEIPSQIGLTRTRPGGNGHILFNTNSTLKKSGGALATSLSTLYAMRALVPASP